MRYVEIDGEKYQVSACTRDCPFHCLEEYSFSFFFCNHPKARNHDCTRWNGTLYPKDCPLREEEE